MKQYKLLEITTQYDQYLREFYSNHDDIIDLSYDELYNLLVNDCFAESDFLHRQLNKMGIESKVIFCNNRNLQNKWKQTNAERTSIEILLSQIKEFLPDVILISCISYFSKEETIRIKESLGNKKVKLVGFHFTILDTAFKQNAILYDQIYTGNNVYVNFMKENGLSAYLLRHAFEPDILPIVSKNVKKNEICFLGNIIVGENAHNNRLDMLDSIIKSNLPYVFHGNIYGLIQEVLSSESGRKYMAIISEVARNMKTGVFGLKYYSTLSQYNICLNMHGTRMNYGAGNLRMFEATGVGTCLLTDDRSENADLFDINDEIVVYSSFEDLIEKAKWLIRNPKTAIEIALSGQKKTLNKHTYRNKAECLNEYIQKILK